MNEGGRQGRGGEAVWGRLLVLGVLLGLAVPFYGVVLGWETFCYRDFGVLAYPSLFYGQSMLAEGVIPLWNPLSNCGAPFLAQWGTMLFYPGTWVLAILPQPWGVPVFMFGHLALGAAGVCRWLRDRGWHGWGGTLGGMAFVFNGVMFSCLIWPNYAVALGWMPWVVWLAGKAWQEGGRWLAPAGVVGALQLLAGVPEVTGMTWLLGAGMALSDGGGWKRLRRGLGRWALVWGMIAGLSAVQLLPFFELLLNSQRAGGYLETKWALPPWGAANFFVPLYGNLLTPQGVFFQEGQHFFSSVYLGIGTVLLAVLAVVTVRSRTTWALAAMAVLGVVLAIGDANPVFSWLRQLVPALGVARYPVKFLLLTLFAVAALAGIGLQVISQTAGAGSEREGEVGRLRWACIGLGAGAALVIGALILSTPWQAVQQNGWMRLLVLALFFATGLVLWRSSELKWRAGACAVMTGLVVGEAYWHVPVQNPTVPAAALAPGLWEQEVEEDLLARVRKGRAFIRPEAEEKLLKSGVGDLYQDLLGKRLALWSHLNLLEGVAKVNGSSTLQVKYQKRVEQFLYEAGTAEKVREQWLDFLGVQIETSEESVVEWTARPGGMALMTAGQRVRIGSDEEVWGAVTAEGFDPRNEVWLSREEGEGPGPAAMDSVAGTEVREVVREAGLWRARVDGPGPSVVVVAESFYPAWRAYVDGESVPVWRANYGFMALAVPPGPHEVVLRYEDRWFQAGSGISAVTLLLLIGWWWRQGR